jgi:hypothetical protein
MNDIQRLEKVIRDLYGCDSMHVQSVHVHETIQETVVWDADVEVFLLVNYSRAKRAYAWSFTDDFGQLRDITIRGVPPINSAVDAVRAYVGVEVIGSPRPLSSGG